VHRFGHVETALDAHDPGGLGRIAGLIHDARVDAHREILDTTPSRGIERKPEELLAGGALQD
jgi:hypothetical protein